MIHKTDIFATPTICGAALALALAAGCSKQSVQSQSESSFPEDRIIRVSPEVVTTKGTYTTDNLTKFDLLVEDDKSPASKYTYSNTVFKRGESGWASDKTLLWSKSDATVLVYAIAPSVGLESLVSVDDINYGQSGVALEVQAEQSNDDSSSDYLGWASGLKPVSELLGEDGKLSFAFTHLLARLTVTFKLGTEFNVSGVPAQDIISDVVISGTARDFKIRGTTGYTSFTVESGTAASDIKPYNVAWNPAADKTGNCTSVYEGIIVPQTVAAGDFKVSFKLSGEPLAYAWTSETEMTFNGNTAYRLTIKVGKDAVHTGTFSAGSWEEHQWENPDDGILETE